MNRLYKQFRLSLEYRVIDLFCQFAVGASGAPTINAGKSKGILSVVRNSAGRYTITLQDKYVDLYQLTQMITLASGSPAAVGGLVVRSVGVSSSTPTVVVEFIDSSGAAVEVASGATVNLNLILKGSVV